MCTTYTNDKGETLTIDYDQEPMSPREWDDNLGEFLVPPRCKYAPAEADVYMTWEDAEEDEKALADYFYLPVYALDHSGVALRCSSFGDPWDSGLIGYYIVPKDRIRKEYNVRHISPRIRKKVLEILEAEVRTYSQYIGGEVYGYEITDANGDYVDSCYGYYSEQDILDMFPDFKEAI